VLAREAIRAVPDGVYRSTISNNPLGTLMTYPVALTVQGDTITVDASQGLITNEATGKRFKATQFPQFMQDLIANGGLLRYAEKRLEAKRAAKA